MNDKDLNEAIETTRTLWASTGSKTEAGKEAYSHLTGLMGEQMRRALAKPSSLESEIALELGLKCACVCQ